MQYFSVLTVPGSNYKFSAPLREQEGWKDHALFMDRLSESEFVLLGGPVGEGWARLLALSANDSRAAYSRLGDDPWAKSDMLRIALFDRWNIKLNGLDKFRMRGKSESKEYYAVKRKFGPSWNYDLEMNEQKEWEEHANFMDDLVDRDLVVLGGPLNDGPYVQLILESESMSSLFEVLQEDPWEKSGLLTEVSVQYWNLLLFPQPQ